MSKGKKNELVTVVKPKPQMQEVPKPKVINPVPRQTLEELFQTARSFGLVTASETRHKPFGGTMQKGFFVRISIHEDDGIELQVKSHYCEPTLQAGLRACIDKARKATQMTWEHNR